MDNAAIGLAPYHIMSMPPMPPMPPGIAGASFFGSSAIMASVVTSRRSNRSCVLKGGANDLDRVDDAHGDHVAIFAGLGVVAEVVLVLVEDLADNDRSFVTSVLSDLAGRSLQSATNDVDAGFLVVVHTLGR